MIPNAVSREIQTVRQKATMRRMALTTVLAMKSCCSMWGRRAIAIPRATSSTLLLRKEKRINAKIPAT